MGTPRRRTTHHKRLSLGIRQLAMDTSLHLFSTKGNTMNFEVKQIPRESVKDIVQRLHYTHSLGKVTIAFGLYDTRPKINGLGIESKQLVGAITFGQVSSRDLAQSLFEGGTQENTLELLRMVVIDDCECERSFFISKTLKHIKKVFPNIKAIVSFADFTQGHYGIVYQAANFIYCGQTGKKYHYLKNGKRINKRVVFDKAKQLGITESDFSKQRGFEKKEELPKFRYVYFLDKKAKLKLTILAYPKPSVKP